MKSRSVDAGFGPVRYGQPRQERVSDTCKLAEPAIYAECGAIYHAG